MNISDKIFKNNNPFTIGVEEEYMLCDPKTGELVNKADDIINNLEKKFVNRFSYELILSEIEINTSVSDTVSDTVDKIKELRRYVKFLGEKMNFRIGISGTHPTALCVKQEFVDNKSYNWVSDQLKYYAKRNVTFSMHVHIAVEDEKQAIHITNAMRRWIAPLLALSTNSPFFESYLTGMRSTRTLQFSNFPRTNIPIKFESFDDYLKLINSYIENKAISKPRQVWWKIRPHLDYGTIEFRMCDAQRSLKNVEMIIAICQALVYQASIDYKNKKLKEDFNLELLNDALWKASRFSFDAYITDPVTNKNITISDNIKNMICYIERALNEFGNNHIISNMEKILINGTECDEQIKIYDNYGFNKLKKYLMKNVEYN